MQRKEVSAGWRTDCFAPDAAAYAYSAATPPLHHKQNLAPLFVGFKSWCNAYVTAAFVELIPSLIQAHEQ